MKVKFKKLDEKAVIPQYAKPGDAGLDLVAVTKDEDKHGNLSFGTKLAAEIPAGNVGLLFPRSSVSKTDLTLANCVGVIDSGYRGEIIAKFKPAQKAYRADVKDYSVGDRIVQLIIIPVPTVEIEEVEELSDSDRGEGSFGSTGK